MVANALAPCVSRSSALLIKDRSLSYMKKDLKYLCLGSVEEWYEF